MYSRTLDFDHLLHNFYNKELISKYFYVIIRFPLCGFNVMQPRSEGPSSPHPKMKIIVNNSIPALSLFGSLTHERPSDPTTTMSTSTTFECERPGS